MRNSHPPAPRARVGRRPCTLHPEPCTLNPVGSVGGWKEGWGGRRPPHPRGDDQRLRFGEDSLELFSSESCF
jgi:hypothetical protein